MPGSLSLSPVIPDLHLVQDRGFLGDKDKNHRLARLEIKMEQLVTIHIEKLPEGVYLATSDEIQGLVAQGRTVWETLEIARDVARKLLELQSGKQRVPRLHPVAENFDYPLVLGT